jgi:4-diphosphocytidyl-2-C-methyl-D-erythritol kinase
MILFPNAKINIGLSVIRKRKDGYHDIETVMYPIGLCDVLEYIKDEEYKQGAKIPVTYSGDISFSGQNTCMKVIDRLKELYHVPPIKMHLLKNIPTGAGLGGGSSDAAFLLYSLNKTFSFGLSDTELEELSGNIGSDCPFFIRNRPSFVTSRGNKLQDIPVMLKGYFLMLIYPGIQINTKEAYEEVIPGNKSVHLDKRILEPVEQWQYCIKNQFEESLFRKYPLLAKIKKELYKMGAVYASMSGSGSALYGIFRSGKEIPSKFNSYFTYQEMLKI